MIINLENKKLSIIFTSYSQEVLFTEAYSQEQIPQACSTAGIIYLFYSTHFLAFHKMWHKIIGLMCNSYNPHNI